MTLKHHPITGFRFAKQIARRSRTTNENRPIRLAEIRLLIGELVASARHHGQAQAALASIVEYNAQPAGKPVIPPQRKVFDLGPIDHSKSTLQIISMVDAEARCRRETLMHFGQDPNL
ncbi:hypothetical protein [Burkholderia lata]|jgi:hypothetical protein|uniref:hypothetical protein n=1 Tax=Burkholderia lata (strain ATCC 17760 / DSM 23089 / LMG 22485 / NCIMB 9086 / R18194 / 383) TaxID=482957 RepID=UPI00145399D1|nr:hypothetical protein [Burkholderia lata]VWB06930.1 hypothetical protein BLA6860_00134 [Burkholderia lata]VWM11604.1 hypothetical protein BLA6992_04418 [Burkholderia lata]